MRNNLTKIAMAASLWLAMIFTLSCDAAVPSALAEHWMYLSGSKKDKPENMELFKDGTGVCDGVSVSWKVENKRLVLQSSLFGIASDYKVSGSKLTLIYNDGDSTVFAKKADYEKVVKQEAEEKKRAEAAAAEKIASAFKAKVKKGSFTDSRDGKSYKTLKLDNQTWMAENLNYNANGSKCYDNSESNCQKYGRLYNWATAKAACPSGWHLPSDAEWGTFMDAVGGSSTAGTMLKAANGWAEGNGIDAAGFSALPGGNGDSDGSFNDVGKYGDWWSAPEHGASLAYYRYMDYDGARVLRYGYDKASLYSVRCVQD